MSANSPSSSSSLSASSQGSSPSAVYVLPAVPLQPNSATVSASRVTIPIIRERKETSKEVLRVQESGEVGADSVPTLAACSKEVTKSVSSVWVPGSTMVVGSDGEVRYEVEKKEEKVPWMQSQMVEERVVKTTESEQQGYQGEECSFIPLSS